MGQPLLAMPSWELLAPPPPLPPLPEAPSRPKLAVAKPGSKKPQAKPAATNTSKARQATNTAKAKGAKTKPTSAPTLASATNRATPQASRDAALALGPLRWVAEPAAATPPAVYSPLHASLQAASAPAALVAKALRWEIVTPAGSTGLVPTPLAEPHTGSASLPLNPSTGFPTVARTSGLVWEVAPSRPSSQDLLAIAEERSTLLNGIDTPGAVVSDATVSSQSRAAASTTVIALAKASPESRQGLVQPPAPQHTASGLRWELVDDPKAVLAEQPDPETLTTPVALRYQPPYLLSPYIGGAVPSAYVAGWGDFYVSGSAATAGKTRDGTVDGSFNTGMGFGDADRYVAIEVDWGIGSIKNFNFNGGFSGAIGRNLIRNDDIHLAISGGVIEFIEYGSEVDTEPASPYGALSLTLPLRPSSDIFQQRLQVTVGGGGAAFGWRDENFQGPDAGFFASLGLEITRNAGISAAWSGRGMNANFSYVPFRDIPVSVNVLAADLFNSSPYGRVGVLTLTWGSNFANGVF